MQKRDTRGGGRGEPQGGDGRGRGSTTEGVGNRGAHRSSTLNRQRQAAACRRMQNRGHQRGAKTAFRVGAGGRGPCGEAAVQVQQQAALRLPPRRAPALGSARASCYPMRPSPPPRQPPLLPSLPRRTLVDPFTLFFSFSAFFSGPLAPRIPGSLIIPPLLPPSVLCSHSPFYIVLLSPPLLSSCF